MTAGTEALTSKVSTEWPRSWVPVAIGLLVLYVPTLFRLMQDVWSSEDQAYGPFIAAAACWLFWSARARIVNNVPRPRPLSGALLLGFGLLVYVVGRSQNIFVFEVGSLLPVLIGVLLLLEGMGLVRALWFPLLYLVFIVPLPGVLVDALTGLLKQWASGAAEHLLYFAGYPIARQGVMLTMGQYQLLMADACSGLHSLFALIALGLLFLHLMRRHSWWHNGIMLASILPIAFAANVARVVILALVTYHFGDAAAQGLLHGALSLILFTVALSLLFILDALLGVSCRLLAKRAAAKGARL